MSSKRLTIVFVLLFLILSGCAQQPLRKLPSPTPAHIYFARGMEKLEKGDLPEALEEFKKARNADANFPATYAGMALVALEQGECEVSLRQIEEAKRRFASADIYIAEGRILTRCRNYPDWLFRALASYEMALKLVPENDATYFYQGETYRSAYKLSEAAEAFQKAARQRGRFSQRAGAELETVRAILKAAPQTEVAVHIALKRQITRADLAALLSAELHLSKKFDKGEVRHRPSFTEVTDIAGHWAQNWIESVAGLGLVGLEPFPDGTFKPDIPVTRASFALTAQNMLYLVSDDPQLTTRHFGESSRFTDVESDEYIYNAVVLCVEKGIFQLQSDGSFGPAKYVSGIDALRGVSRLREIIGR